MRHHPAAVVSFVLLALLGSSGSAAEVDRERPLSREDWIDILKNARPAPNPPPARSFTADESASPEQRMTVEFDPVSRTQRILPAGTGSVLLSEGADGVLEEDPAARMWEAVDGERLPSDTRFWPLSDATAFPYNTVVKLIQRFNVAGVDHFWSCSGALVHDFHIITAGHCAYSWDPDDDEILDVPRWADEIWVFPAQGDAVEPFDWPDFPFGGARVVFNRSYTGWTESHNYDHDWAVLTLNRRDGIHTGWMGKESGVEADVLNASGYPTEADYGFEGELLQFHTHATVLDYDTYRIHVAAFLYGGQSGGPAWRYQDGARRIQGVLSTSSRTGSAHFTRMTSGKHADLNNYIFDDQTLRPPVPRPDLQECFFSQWGCSKDLVSSSVGQGGSLLLTYNVLNSGFANSGDLRVDYYLSADEWIDTNDILFYSGWATGLEPNTAYNPVVSLPLPLWVPPGPYYVGWILTATEPEYTIGQHGTWEWPNGNNTVVISDETVNVVAIHDLTVTSPNGGEIWFEGSTSAVTWTSRNAGNWVRIELSRNGGSTWETVTPQTQNDGTYSFVVGGPTSDLCRIRVTALDHPSATDASNANFRIIPGLASILVTAPNGGEQWIVGRDYDITWSSLLAGPTVKIELSRNSGLSWQALALSTSNDGRFTWTATGPAAGACWIRVSSLSSPTVTDTSDGGFSLVTLLSTIHVLSPNGGETAWVGYPLDVTWTSSFVTGNVKIELTRTGGLTWETIAADTPNDGYFNWAVTAPTSGFCRFRVSAVNDPLLSDTSDGSFAVGLLLSSIHLIAPDGGETWYVGHPHNITWSSSYLPGDVKIELTKDAGLTWQTIVASTPNDGLFIWWPTLPLSTSCAIRVLSVNTPIVSDTSSGTFAIALLLSSINVTSPNGGERWFMGGTYDITWTSSDLTSDVRIEATRDAGSSWELLAASTPNDGLFEWTVDAPEAGACRVRITAVSTSAATDMSDENFQIDQVEDVFLRWMNPTEDGGIIWLWLDTLGEDQYEVYRGELTPGFTFQHDTALACGLPAGTTNLVTESQMGPGYPSYYYLVVPRIGDLRLYGEQSDGAPRPPSASECP